MILRRIQFYASMALAVLLVLVGAYATGYRRARRAAEQRDAITAADRAQAAVETSRDVQTHLDALPVGGAAAELRRNWMRPSTK